MVESNTSEVMKP